MVCRLKRNSNETAPHHNCFLERTLTRIQDILSQLFLFFVNLSIICPSILYRYLDISCMFSSCIHCCSFFVWDFLFQAVHWSFPHPSSFQRTYGNNWSSLLWSSSLLSKSLKGEGHGWCLECSSRGEKEGCNSELHFGSLLV